MARTEKRVHETTAEKLQWLAELRDEARHAGSAASVAKQRDQGKLLAELQPRALGAAGSGPGGR